MLITSYTDQDFSNDNMLEIIDKWIPHNVSDEIKKYLLLHVRFIKGNSIKSTLLDYVPYNFSPYLFNPEIFHASTSIVFDNKKNSEQVKCFVEKWLLSLPFSILPHEEVYLLKRQGDLGIPNWCAVTKWQDFCSIIWYYFTGGFEKLTVLDDTFQWMIYFGMENAFIFVEPGGVDTKLSKKDNAFGWNLKRVKNQPDRPPWKQDNFVRINLNKFPCECQGPCHKNCPCFATLDSGG
jgi:hypothetical protein